MSTYTSSGEENVILKNDDNILVVNLTKNVNLKVLIIDNLPNLKKVIIPAVKVKYVNISNCEKLNTIYNFVDGFQNEYVYGDYFYLGNNLKSLKDVNLIYYNKVKFEDCIFESLSSIDFNKIKELICNFENFPNLNQIKLKKVKVDNLISNSKNITDFVIIKSTFGDIKLTQKNYIDDFKFIDNEYISLKIEKPVNVMYISLSNNGKIIPYIPLCDEIDENIKFYIDVENIYDSEYKYFIERNSSKINLLDVDNINQKLDLDEIKFNVPQKKRAT